jgi:hypothetical protein
MIQTLNTIRVAGSGSDTTPPIAFHPNEPWVVVGSLIEGHITAVDCATGVVSKLAPIAENSIQIAFDLTGKQLISISENLITFCTLGSSPVISSQVPLDAEFLDDLWVPTLHNMSGDIWVFFWNKWIMISLTTGRVIRTIDPPPQESLLHVARLPSGDCVAVTYDDEATNHPAVTLSLINLTTNDVSTLPFDEWHNINVSPAATLAVSCAQTTKDTFLVWDLVAGKLIRTIDDLNSTGRRCFVSDNRHLVAEVSDDATEPWTSLVIADLLSGSKRTLDAQAPFCPAFSCSPVNPVLVTIANSNKHPVDVTSFWNPISGEWLGSTSGHVGIARHSFSPCGRWFATVSNAAGEEIAVDPMPGGSLVITNIGHTTK